MKTADILDLPIADNTNAQPRAPGFYWWRKDRESQWEPVFSAGPTFRIGDLDASRVGEFGPRIELPEALR